MGESGYNVNHLSIPLHLPPLLSLLPMRILKFLLLFVLAVFCVPLLALSGTYLYLTPNLPDTQTLRHTKMQVPLRIYSADGQLMAEFGEMRRSPLRYDQIPRDFINALLAAEDDGFATHSGVDPKSLLRAASELVSSGEIRTGGSTITMQVAKNFFLSSERSFSRKANEILLALQIERTLTKEQILELYINKIYLGNRAYGIEAAAQIYYGKSINELSLGQMATIAGLPKAPSRYNPVVNPERAKVRRDWILSRMLELGHIDGTRYAAAKAESIEAVRSKTAVLPQLEAPYIAEMTRAEMVARYGNEAYTEGYRVYTTVRSDLQEAANRALRDGLRDYDQRHGWRGAEAKYPNASREIWITKLAEQSKLGDLEPAIVTTVNPDGIRVLLRNGQEETVNWATMRWARPLRGPGTLGAAPKRPADVVARGDLIRVLRAADGRLQFSQMPHIQGALVSLDPQNGAIRALTGGFSFEQSNYNRAAQAKRQPGSSFKPFVYSAALEKGFTAASVFDDGPYEAVNPGTGEIWRPQNSDGSFLGPLRLREALYRSRNLVSIRLLEAIGVNYMLDYSERVFSLPRSDLPQGLSMALGSAGLTPLEIATGYTVFANSGYKVQPYLIARIDDRDGKEVFKANPNTVPNNSDTHAPQAERVMDARTAYITTSILQDVITRGTARKALALKRTDLAGKTGTTNDQKDAWFSGYNGDFVATAWVGFDQPQNLGRGEFGGEVALPIWMDYMAVALKDRPAHLPPEPSGILRIRIDPATGRTASASTPGAFFELFRSDMPPSEPDPVDSNNGGFFQDKFGGERAPVPLDLF